MPFLLYKTDRLPEGVLYCNPNHVKLGGGGLIQTTARKYLQNADTTWKVTASDLIGSLGHDPDKHALVVDTSPSRPTLNLFQIESIAGYSYAAWTPIMITFKALFADEEHDIGDNPDLPASLNDFKQRFELDASEGSCVRSILYLMGGFESGNWNWGGNSRTTAALLWKDAWDYFRSC